MSLFFGSLLTPPLFSPSHVCSFSLIVSIVTDLRIVPLTSVDSNKFSWPSFLPPLSHSPSRVCLFLLLVGIVTDLCIVPLTTGNPIDSLLSPLSSFCFPSPSCVSIFFFSLLFLIFVSSPSPQQTPTLQISLAFCHPLLPPLLWFVVSHSFWLSLLIFVSCLATVDSETT